MVPLAYDNVLQLVDQYKSSSHKCQHGGEQGGGIAIAQKGKAAAAAAAEKAAASANDSLIKKKTSCPRQKGQSRKND